MKPVVMRKKLCLVCLARLIIVAALFVASYSPSGVVLTWPPYRKTQGNVHRCLPGKAF